ncbi:11582_t:CDS:10 [Funneliformis caledonium]|uniref:Glutathione hydrolase n=1 Tax=Funneliformis caledonium TaxID=1117310 RepID=A0A9N8WJF3_9GLOM|nr:11582_t:CDS:10 [Funneliformis caledonium]
MSRNKRKGKGTGPGEGSRNTPNVNLKPRRTPRNNGNSPQGSGGRGHGHDIGVSNEEIERVNARQHNALLENLQSSALSYDGSDKLVFLSSNNLEGAWRNLIRKEFRDQRMIKYFITSCLLDADKQTGVAIETLVEQLGNPKLGILRLREICQYKISVDAGFKKDTASFQSVILPFLALLIRHGVRGSTLERQVNTIYSVVYTYIDTFFHDNIMKCLDELVRRNSLQDRGDKEKSLNKDPNIFIPSTFDSLMTERQLKVQSDDALVSDLEKRRYYFEILNHEMKKLDYVLSDGRKSLIAARSEVNNTNNTVTSELVVQSREFARMNEFERLYDPPDPYDSLLLNVQDETSRENAIRKLATPNVSVFDETQAKALVDALSREIALIEDFPDLLLNIESEESNVLPDETDKNGDKDEWTTVGEEKLKNQSIWDQWINGVDIRRREQLVQAIYRNQNATEKNMSKKGKERDDLNERPNNMYEFLKNIPRDDETAEDGDESEEENAEDTFNYDESQKIRQNNGNNYIKSDETDETEYWLQKLVIPDGDRDLETLLEDTDVWNMSRVERKRLHDHLREAIRKEVIIDLADFEMKIIIVEEAGEVLEAHILSALTPSTQHLILIGDHLQLRPHIATYTLSVDSQPGEYFMLDRSLFERLVNEGVTMSQLTIQRRMRPEIADLIRGTLYPKLTDVIDERDNQDITELLGEADPEYENPIGTVSIAEKRSLQRQVTLKTVDNFQGEEATIVIVSLVRNTTSGSHGNIGFLKSSNRTNVLLSRAKHGMFMLGNAELLSERSDMWKSVIGLMRKRGQVGETFPILCESHPDIINYIESPEEFQKSSPDGGCNSPCRRLMPWYIFNNDFEILCGDPCGECQIIVEDILLSCGHYFTSPKCYQSQDPKSIMCYTMVTRILPTCGHELNVRCSSSIDSLRCDHECGIILEGCGHSCKNKCCECQKRSIAANNKEPKIDQQGHIVRTNHLKCIQRCGRILYCGHACAASCHKGACPPCKENCSVECHHSKCTMKCSEPCITCAEQCNWICEHQGGCALSCSAPCSRLPCDLQCQKLLSCGHRCVSVCGEECPPQKYCVLCANDEIKSQVVDIYLQESFEEVDWKVHRLIVLECGHCFTMESMDSLMELDKYYVIRETTWIGLKIPPEEMSKVKCCPNCRHPINSIRRYGRVSKKITLDAAKMKFLQKYTRSLKNTRDSLEKTVKELENKRDQFIEKIVKSAKEKSIGKDYYKSQALNTKVPELTPVQQFAEIVQHDISKVHETLWANHVFRLIGCYREIFLIMTGTKDPPYKRAFDAAVVNLYHLRSAAETEIDVLKLAEQMETLNLSGKSSMHQLTLQRECLQQVGIPLPVVSYGIYVKAFFEVVHIQKVMFMEAKHVVHALDLTLHENINQFYLQSVRDTTTLQSISIRNSWIKFTRFILETTVEHLKIICEVAKETKYYRDYAFALLELSEIQCHHGGFILSYEIIDSNKSASEQATRIKKSVSRLCEDVQQSLISLQSLIGLIDGEYIQKQFISRMQQISKDVNELENCRGKAILRSEKLEIFRAMNIELQGSGHWYQCPNGHTYAIANCGLANQASHCPECGANVGGINYNLSAGNTRTIPIPTDSKLVIARNGAVAAEQQDCSNIGVEILKEGGSAVDAAIAAELCVGTINAFSAGIGGGGFMIIRDSDGTSETIDFREIAPAAANNSMFKDDPELAKYGGLSVGVPGEILGMEIAHKKYGKLPWKRLFEPSIKLSRDGFKIPFELSKRMRAYRKDLEGTPDLAAIYAPNGILLGEGDLLKRSNFSKTLELIANNGSDVFYKGSIADSIIKSIRSTGGIMTHEDLATFKPIISKPIQGYYHGRKVMTLNTPSGGPVLLSMLNILEGYRLSREGLDGKNLHRIIETLKFGFAMRTEMGDPLFTNNLERIEEIMTKDFAAKIRKNISDSITFEPSYYNPIYDVLEDHGTTHVSVVDKYNQAVSLTSTVNLIWGSRVLDSETGILLNDQMDDFSIPGVPNYFGLRPSPYNYVQPKKKPLSSCVPVIIEKNGEFEMAIGGSGGSRILSSILQVLLNVYEFDKDILESIDAPRVHHQLLPNEISIETGYSEKLMEELRKRNHSITIVDFNAGKSEIQAVMRLSNGLVNGNRK